MVWHLLIEPTTRVIWTAAILFGALSLMLVIATFVVSGSHHRRKLRHDALDKAWRDWLLRCHFGATTPPRATRDCERGYLAQRWLELLLSVDGVERSTLAETAKKTELPVFILGVLAKPKRHRLSTVEACATLAGVLPMPESVAYLVPLLSHRVTPVAFAAAVALVRLDPREIVHVWEKARVFEWSKAALVTFLKVGPSAEIDAVLRHRIENCPPREAAQLLVAWAQLPGRAAVQYAAELLRNPQATDWLLSAALRLQDDPTLLPLYRKYLEHPHWPLRLQAVRALGRHGHGEDLALLEAMKQSNNWWLRTRAREATAFKSLR